MRHNAEQILLLAQVLSANTMKVTQLATQCAVALPVDMMDLAIRMEVVNSSLIALAQSLGIKTGSDNSLKCEKCGAFKPNADGKCNDPNCIYIRKRP